MAVRKASELDSGKAAVAVSDASELDGKAAAEVRKASELDGGKAAVVVREASELDGKAAAEVRKASELDGCRTAAGVRKASELDRGKTATGVTEWKAALGSVDDAGCDGEDAIMEVK